MIVGIAIVLVVGGIYGVNSTTNLVGPAPFAGSEDQQVIDPPDRAFSGSSGVNMTVENGRICASVELEYFDGEEHQTQARLCDPDAAAIMSVATEYLEIRNAMEPSGVVVVAAAVAPEVERVELELPDRSQPSQELTIQSFNDHPRRMAAHAFGRDLFLNKRGRFDAVIRAFDGNGMLVAEQAVCDPGSSGSVATC
jgi:hypothetical protein